MDVDALSKLIDRAGRERIPLVMLTVTNNTGGGQPVSMANVARGQRSLSRHGIPCTSTPAASPRTPTSSSSREEGYADRRPRRSRRRCSLSATACTMSAKKDGLANIGGFLCTNDDALARQEENLLILTEGYPTYGGLAGRDLEAIAVGLKEALEEDYLKYRIFSTAYLGRHLADAGIPIVEPPGGHAIYIDARRFLPDVPPARLPGVALACELYLEGGVRAAEIGTLMFGANAQMDFVRLAIPRRVYTQSHIDYVIEVVRSVWKGRDRLRGMTIVHEEPFLRHFTAHLAPR